MIHSSISCSNTLNPKPGLGYRAEDLGLRIFYCNVTERILRLVTPNPEILNFVSIIL